MSPSKAQLNALLAYEPSVPGFRFKEPDDTTGYKVTWDFVKSNPPYPAAQVGDPDVESPTGSTITHGPYQGFKGLITPYNIIVTARSNAGGAEVRMKRTLQTIAVPVFQFGIFSETDLAFHAGETFTFGGRVHTNGNLFLAEADGQVLTISDRITAVGDVVRTHLPNGLLTSTGYDGTVRIPTTIMANPVNNVYRNLLRTEGSSTGTPVSGYNNKWTGLSKSTYTLNIRTGEKSADGIGTGAKKLDLPLVSQGATPIDLIRRPQAGVERGQHRQARLPAALLRASRHQPAHPVVGHGGRDHESPGPRHDRCAGGLEPARDRVCRGPRDRRDPSAARAFPVLPLLADGALPANVYKSTGAPMINGFIKIEMQRKDMPGTWRDVTAEILSLGIAGRNLATNVPATAVASRWNNARRIELRRVESQRDHPPSACARCAPRHGHDEHGGDAEPRVRIRRTGLPPAARHHYRRQR